MGRRSTGICHDCIMCWCTNRLFLSIAEMCCMSVEAWRLSLAHWKTKGLLELEEMMVWKLGLLRGVNFDLIAICIPYFILHRDPMELDVVFIWILKGGWQALDQTTSHRIVFGWMRDTVGLAYCALYGTWGLVEASDVNRQPPTFHISRCCASNLLSRVQGVQWQSFGLARNRESLSSLLLPSRGTDESTWIWKCERSQSWERRGLEVQPSVE